MRIPKLNSISHFLDKKKYCGRAHTHTTIEAYISGTFSLTLPPITKKKKPSYNFELICHTKIKYIISNA